MALDLDAFKVVTVVYFFVVVTSRLGGCVVEKQAHGHMQEVLGEGA